MICLWNYQQCTYSFFNHIGSKKKILILLTIPIFTTAFSNLNFLNEIKNKVCCKREKVEGGGEGGCYLPPPPMLHTWSRTLSACFKLTFWSFNGVQGFFVEIYFQAIVMLPLPLSNRNWKRLSMLMKKRLFTHFGH